MVRLWYNYVVAMFWRYLRQEISKKCVESVSGVSKKSALSTSLAVIKVRQR